MVSEQLEESLRSEIDSFVDRRLGVIKQDISQLQNQLNDALKLILESEGEGQWDGSLAASITEHLRAAHERGVEMAAAESSRTQASSDMAIVKTAIEEIGNAGSQAEILKALVNRASSFAPRAAFFVVKNEQARGWRARGFQGSVGDEAVNQIGFAIAADTMVGEVARSRQTWSGTPSSHTENHLILNRLGEDPPQRVVAVPLVVRGRAVGVLYADSAELDADAINLEALETLVSVAGMAVGLLSVSPAAVAKPHVEPAPAPVVESVAPALAYTPEREYEAAEPVETAPVETVEPVAPAPAEFVTEPNVPADVATEAEVFAGVSADAEVSADIEPIAVQAEPQPVLAAQTGPLETPEFAPVQSARRRSGYDAALPVVVDDEEEKRLHSDARRFARLLVSEIKLYNEQKVIEGRATGDLYDRLREYIDRSREMYDKRVRPSVSARYDYFHHELITTLAEGDESKLGATYPGTTVAA